LNRIILMRKQFFTSFDSVLPRWLAKLPYEVALIAIKVVLGSQVGVGVWNRNSTRTGSFILGVSDLDISALAQQEVSSQRLYELLKKLKRVFIFLGETNLYRRDQLGMILPRMNSFELKRDPDLEKLAVHERSFDEVEKFVFTQRMLFSDALTLNENPKYRQAKWKFHMNLIGVEAPSIIEIPFVIDTLKKLSGFNPRISDSLDLWREHFHRPEFDVYRSRLGPGLKILAPHCHVWFQVHEDRAFLQDLSEQERRLIRRQIDWEVWGLYTQKFHPSQTTVREHLKRLTFAYRYVAGEIEAIRLEKEISLVFSV
jgi:hypothetical protein